MAKVDTGAWGWVALWIGLVASAPLAAQETVCARVKIEIKQELTLERQAFDAEMRITNSLPLTPLTEVDVEVRVTDENGTPVIITEDPNDLSAKFFIRQTSKQHIADTTGSGEVAGATTATINWMLIPAPGAAGLTPFGKKYLVGATLSYKFGTETHVLELNPDVITVKPLPSLTLDYFLTRDVIADDPFTAPIEAPEPYTLGVRVKNTGMAPAQELKIDSAQPRIIDNEQGLPISFQIIGSYVQDMPASNSLLINFGDIAPGTSKMGRWQMESNLAGTFVDFTATFTHSDELGGALTSLLQATNANLLLRDVRVDLPGRDVVRDFLATDLNGTVLKVYESDGADNAVTVRSDEATLTAAGGGYRLVLPPSQGFFYVRKPDPYQGQKVLGPVMRADAKAMAVENVWLSKTKNRDTKQWEHWFNVFDVNSPGVYDVAFNEQSAEPVPPVIQFIPDRVIKEEGQLGFLVEASSPNGVPVTLAAEPLPNGATFHDQGDGIAVFDWTPDIGQAGDYVINYLASDGSLSSMRSAKIRVETKEPPPGPSIPELVAPLAGAEAASLRPELQVLTGQASNDPTQSVQFELYADAGMIELVGGASVPESTTAADPTVWQYDEDLNDNTHYYWRARAIGPDSVNSEWVNGEFFVNLFNDAPGDFNLTTPTAGSDVASLTPVLSLTNASDADGDAITYGFEVYTDVELTQRHDGASELPADPSGMTNWTVAIPLVNHETYYWRAFATDEHGAQTATPARSFRVFTGNHAPSTPTIVSPVVGSDVTTPEIALLRIGNSTDGDGDPITYRFEIDEVNTFDSSERSSAEVPADGSGITGWQATGVIENQRYYWRVKANDGHGDSEWVLGEFIMDAANEAPSQPTVANPGDRAWVATQLPTFTVNPAIDPEQDAITYRFEVYRDPAMSNLVASGSSSTESWQPSTALDDKTTHYWRARAEDTASAGSAWTSASTLFVSTGPYVAPTIAVTAPATVMDASARTTSITWTGTDPNIEPTVALYYDLTGTGYAGIKIVDGLEQDAGTHAGSYVWNMADLDPGAYHVYGVIYDDKGLSRAYAPGALVIPAAPQLGGLNVVTPRRIRVKEGRSETFSVALSRAPTSDVVVPLSSNDATEATVQPQQLVFTSTNWSQPQQVTLMAPDDGVRDGNLPFEIMVGQASSKDPHYIGLAAAPVEGTAIDNRRVNVGAEVSVTRYKLVRKKYNRRSGKWKYRYRVQLTNEGPRLKGLIAKVTNATGFEVVKGRLRFKTIGRNESAMSKQEIVLISPLDFGTAAPELTWAFEVRK